MKLPLTSPVAYGQDALETLQYQQEKTLPLEDYQNILIRSGLGERRPLQDPGRLQAMLNHANLIVTARNGSGQLVGIARALTDFAFCCYLSDLAVDQAYQRQGIGKALIRFVDEAIGPHAQLLLLAAPKAAHYYPHIGFRAVENAWSLDEEESAS